MRKTKDPISNKVEDKGQYLRLSSDLQMCTVACVHPHSDVNVHTHSLTHTHQGSWAKNRKVVVTRAWGMTGCSFSLENENVLEIVMTFIQEHACLSATEMNI